MAGHSNGSLIDWGVHAPRFGGCWLLDRSPHHGGTMTDQYRATPQQWERIKQLAKEGWEIQSAIYELCSRIEALEAAQRYQFRSATEKVPTTRLYSYSVGPAKPLDELGQGHTLVSPEPASAEAQPAWRPLNIETTYGSETAADAAQILHAPMVVEGTFDHGGEAYRYKANATPERNPAMPELRAASAEAQGFAILSWSEERQPCEECRYNHCIAETPFGRFLISWKGWKEHPAVTADETPFGDWFECWNSVEEAKSGCQSEYNRRLALVPLPQLQPELRAASAEAQPAGGLVERIEARAGGDGRTAIREMAKWLRDLCPSPGMAAAAVRLEQEADRG
jgi:hypothetical protein